jgi:5'(3')-deoxyribonucleotidase
MKKIFLDLDGTLARFNVRNALERFDKEVGFFANLLAYKNIEVVNELAKTNQLFVISASPNEQADKDKMVWIDKYLPNINVENITLCRLGQNKAQIIQDKYNITINEECYLLDDYTKNLIEWETFGGKGIKRLTIVSDNSTKKWKGLTLKDLKELTNIITI